MSCQLDWRTKRPRYRQRRARRPCFGELLQLDGSHHRWFGVDQPTHCLMNLVDDATGTTLSLVAEQETTEASLLLLKRWIERYGVPHEIYVDLKTVYVSPKRGEYIEEALEESAGFTHFSRACEKLGMTIIKAYSPQAKGRVERSHGVYQDRFVKELKLRGIKTVAEANQLLSDSFIDELNRQFAKEPASRVDAHRSASDYGDLAQIFCWDYTRVVQADWTVRFLNQCYQIEETRPLKVRPKQTVVVREHLGGGVTLWRKNERLPAHRLEARPIKKTREKTGYDSQKISHRSRKNKARTPWSLFNPGWVNLGKQRQSVELTK
ncbi:MAG: ISNCY family transposase [Proteobacteria bacterium]|nr:ISNCY family transposase [Pseudomonadota bacterium]